MPEDTKSFTGTYQPLKKTYQPTQGKLDTSNPPQGGSGVPTNGVPGATGSDKSKESGA